MKRSHSRCGSAGTLPLFALSKLKIAQFFSQSDTIRGILDRMEIEYDAGYQVGLIFEPGHENDPWPYPVEDHNFSAVPISTHLFSGELVPLSDRFAKESSI